MERIDGKIRAIIFDLGGVLIDIDWQVTFDCLARKAQNSQIDWERVSQLIYAAERGEIDASAFRNGLRELMKADVSDSEIDSCWNAMIFDFPPQRKALVRRLREKYPVFLLSNINEIHRKYVESRPYWEPQLFDRIFWSCKLGARKPEPVIYRKVLAETGYPAGNVLFLDDREDNVMAAREVGLNAILVDRPVELILNV